MRQKKNGTGILNTQVSLAVLQGVKARAAWSGTTLQWQVERALVEYLEGGESHEPGRRAGKAETSVDAVVGVASTQTREAEVGKKPMFPPRPFNPKNLRQYEAFPTHQSWAAVLQDRDTGQWFLVIRGRGQEYGDRGACLKALDAMEVA